MSHQFLGHHLNSGMLSKNLDPFISTKLLSEVTNDWQIYNRL